MILIYNLKIHRIITLIDNTVTKQYIHTHGGMYKNAFIMYNCAFKLG